MLKLFKDKLRDERGVTLLMALFALLVASLVCVVILSASVTSVKQAKDSQQQEQDTLMLQSAAKLVADDFSDVNLRRVVVETVDADNKSSFSDPSYTASGCMIPKSFAAVAGQAIERGTVAETEPSSGHFTVTVALPAGYSSDMDVKQTVDVRYIVRNASYTADHQVGMSNQLIFTFSLMPNDGSGKAAQRLYLKMSCDAGTESRVQVDDKKYNWVTEYTWKNPNFYTSEGVS